MTGRAVDLGMLAYDLANMMDRFEYPIDVSAEDIKPHLPAFLSAVQGETVPEPGCYDFDECDEMTLCELATLRTVRTRLAAAGMPRAVALVDALAEEAVAERREDDDADLEDLA